MRLTKAMCAAAVVTVLGAVAAGAQDQPKIYAYHSSHNFCPTGLQPVTMNGEVCCGRPNQSMTYQQVMATSARARAHRADCPVGTKGCTFD